jgi:hypothetical protein
MLIMNLTCTSKYYGDYEVYYEIQLPQEHTID